MSNSDGTRPSVLWARLRFQIIGSLLAAPPPPGELAIELKRLAERTWRHPTTGESVRFGQSTIERWYYQARNEPQDPLRALQRRLRKNVGTQPSVTDAIGRLIVESYQKHPTWTFQLHFDNLAVEVGADPSVGAIPSYTTVCRFMKSRGLLKQRKRRRRNTGTENVSREKRLFEVEHVQGLWHLDFHECSRSVVTKEGRWLKPWLLGVLDDHSRLGCRVQWYLKEEAETLAHGLSQAIQKRGLPRGLLTDNGGAMLAGETQEGLERLGIRHWTTLAETPEQNGKQERFWGTLEMRLMAMLEGVPDLMLSQLNLATQAWVEQEYNRKLHSETDATPLDRFLEAPNVGRPSPSSEALRSAFRMRTSRAQRRGDGTISVEGRRFEIPSRYRTIQRPEIRYARWDLSEVELIDPRVGTLLCTIYPVDKRGNALGRRSTLKPVAAHGEPARESGIAPLLAKLMADYAATDLPPAYLPHGTDEEEES